MKENKITKEVIIEIYNEVLDLRNRLSIDGSGKIFEEDHITLDYVLDLIENNILESESK